MRADRGRFIFGTHSVPYATINSAHTACPTQLHPSAFILRHFVCPPMPSFLPGYAMFALAGAVAAAGPIVIHLLNRRRFRVISWAAMDFLREAVKRNRRILKLRDILLLILRTAAVLLFGLALARPYFASSGSGQLGPGQPI